MDWHTNVETDPDATEDESRDDTSDHDDVREAKAAETAKAFGHDYDVYKATLSTTLICSLKNQLLPVDQLIVLVVEYVAERKDTFVARQRLQTLLLPSFHTQGQASGNLYETVPKSNRIERLLNEMVDQDELAPIDAYLSRLDPVDFDLYSNETCKIFRDDQKFISVLTACQGCARVFWTRVSADGTGRSFAIPRKDVHYLPVSMDDTDHGLYVCPDCTTLCGCTTVVVDFYRRWCSICNQTKCSKHDYRRSPANTSLYQARCDKCRQLLEWGQTLSNILNDPDPHAAFSQVLQTINSKST